MPGLTSNTEAISTIFSKERFFRIPSYQRPFSWDAEQFDDLVCDLRDADRGQQYFLGTIVLHRDGDTLAVVDGQQRLTSLLILLACLRDRLESQEYKDEIQEKIVQRERKMDGIPSRIRLEVRDHEAFHKVVISLNGTLQEVSLHDYVEPERRYFEASQIFHRELSRLNQDELQNLSRFISQKCVLIELTADDFDQAFRLFEVVNDRGKQLRRIDILKSANISPDVISRETVRERIAAKWQDLENEIGEEAFESVFFLVRLLILKDKPQGDLLREFDKRIFKNKDIPISKGENFTDLLFGYVELYRAILIDQDFLDGEADRMKAIKFRSLIFIMNNEFRASEWKACLLSFAKKFQRTGFYEFVCAVEQLFLSHWVKGVRKDERYSDYTSILNAIDSASSPEEAIRAVPVDAAAIIEASLATDIYSAGYCKYFLLRLELKAAEFTTEKRLEAKSIEHVFPQNPEQGSQWQQSLGGQDIKSFVHRLGNLVLISKSKNSSAGNRPFEIKKAKYLEPRVSDFPRSLQVLKEPTWTVDTVTERTISASKLMVEPI